MIHSIIPFFIILIPIVTGILILITGERNKNLREFWTILAATVNFVLVFQMIPVITSGKSIDYTIVTLSSTIALNLHVDALGMIFASLASVLWIVVSIYAIGYMRTLEEHAQTRFFFSFAYEFSHGSDAATP